MAYKNYSRISSFRKESERENWNEEKKEFEKSMDEELSKKALLKREGVKEWVAVPCSSKTYCSE